jgi:glutamate racemase
MKKNPIGIFDSGYGGLTVLKEICAAMPEYDYIYLGDNLRAPYGPLPFETVYEFTLQCVKWFFDQGCPLVILACNTASAKALRTIQQKDLPTIDANKRVLGVIRPTSELIGNFTKTKHVGVMATTGTVLSNSYVLETEKFFPDIAVVQEACPEWVELVESGKQHDTAADEPLKRHIDNLLVKDAAVDCILLACTHYPLLIDKIHQFVPQHIKVIQQGKIVAESLVKYLENHPEIEEKCSKEAKRTFYTTGNEADFNSHASVFFGEKVVAKQINL